MHLSKDVYDVYNSLKGSFARFCCTLVLCTFPKMFKMFTIFGKGHFLGSVPPNASVVVVELYISRSAGDYHSQRTTIFRVLYTKRFTKEQLKNGIPS